MLRKLDENAYKFVLYIYLKCLKCLKAYKIIFLKLHNKVNRITLDKIKTKFSSFYFNTIRNIKVIKLYFIVTFYKYKLKVKSRFGYMYKFIFILYLKLKLLHYIFYLIIVGFMNVVEYLIYLKKKIAKKSKKRPK
jgi:hypothetical protein